MRNSPKRKKRALLLSFLPLLILISCQCSAGKIAVHIQGQNGELIIRAEVADTGEERARGLMFREELPEGEGMLFVFPEETSSPFWMKNTPISLDLIFIRDDRIIDVIPDAVPFSESLLNPDASYTEVIEVPGGYAARHGVAVGNTVAK